MTLVLSMNPFLEPEGEPPFPTYQAIWKTERCGKTGTCPSNSTSPGHAQHQLKPGHNEGPFRRLPDHVAMSRIAYFKRKFVDEDQASFSFRTYCQTVAPVLEERAHVLRLSLEKMRFIEDPEVFLRRSVLVNNLLRRLRADILLQSTEWCFSPNPLLTGSVLAPPSAPTQQQQQQQQQQALNRSVATPICLASQAGPPFRKRFRTLRAGQGDLGDDCTQTCCCIYAAAAAAAAAGHYLHLPLSMYDAQVPGPHSSSSSSSSSSSPSPSFFQIASHPKLGLTVVDGPDDDDDEIDEEEEGEEEEGEEEEQGEDLGGGRQAGPSSHWLRLTSRQKSRTRTAQAHPCGRTRADSCVTEREEAEPEEEAHGGPPCEWGSASEGDLHSLQRGAHPR